jgi:hypothetical protein
MRSIFGDVQSVFEEELGLHLPIIYHHVMLDPEEPRNGTTIRDFLLEHGNITAQIAYPGFNEVQKHVCLVHVMIARDFRDQLGLARVCRIIDEICSNVPGSQASLGMQACVQRKV